MKQLLLILGLVAMSLPAVAQNFTQLTPVFFYHNPTNGWNDKPDTNEAPTDDRKNWYFDGIGTGTFDDEDLLMFVTYGNDGNTFTNYDNAYKINHVEYRLPNGTFRPFYLYVSMPQERAARIHRLTRIHYKRVLMLLHRINPRTINN